MFVYLVKFIHLLATLGLLGLAIYCLLLAFSTKFANLFPNPKQKISRLNKVMLLLAGMALLTGTLLVHPKHFTFHTPWIDAAYALVIVVGLILIVSTRSIISRKTSVLIYLFLIIVFLIVIHDAITKTTFLF